MRNPFRIFTFLFKLGISIVFVILAAIYVLIWFIMSMLSPTPSGEMLDISAPFDMVAAVATEADRVQNDKNYSNNIDPSIPVQNENNNNNEASMTSSNQKDIDKILPQKTKNYQVPVQAPNIISSPNIQPQELNSNNNLKNNEPSKDQFINIIK